MDDRPPAVTGNVRAFRVLVRNALFRRVTLAALRRYDELGELDGEDGLGRARPGPTRSTPYFEEHDELGTGPDARGPALLLIETGPASCGRSGRSSTTRPATTTGASRAEVDLAESDATGAAAVRITDVGQL